MSNAITMTREERERRILELFDLHHTDPRRWDEGWSRERVALECACSVQTVARVLAASRPTASNYGVRPQR
jgi:hypothetical protein